MKRMIAIAACVASLSVAASAQDAKWISIVDGKTMGDFGKVGAANWRIEGGALVADKLEGKDPSYLVTKEKYKDFQIHQPQVVRPVPGLILCCLGFQAKSSRRQSPDVHIHLQRR